MGDRKYQVVGGAPCIKHEAEKKAHLTVKGDASLIRRNIYIGYFKAGSNCVLLFPLPMESLELGFVRVEGMRRT